VDIAEATGALFDYARNARKGTVVVTRRGKPLAAVVAVDPEDWEDWVVAHDPGFIALMERSEARYRAEGGLTSDQVRAQLGIKQASRRRRR
jgi:prevent-host-death family protein